MKRLISILFVLSALVVHASGEKTLLEEANRHYVAQEYREAAEKYEQILASGKESAEVYFNLGNACFKNGEHVKAILNYERAKLLAPQNEDIDFNLRIANQFVVDNLEPGGTYRIAVEAPDYRPHFATVTLDQSVTMEPAMLEKA